MPSKPDGFWQATRSGVAAYLAKIGLFSTNAKLVLVYTAFTGLAFGVFQLLFNFYILSLGSYDELFIGNLQTAASIAMLVTALPAAYVVDRFSQKGVMVATGVLSAIAFLGIVMFQSAASLIAFRMLAGLAMSTRQIAVAPFLMNNTHDEERQYVFSFNFGMMHAAQFVGQIAGGSLPLILGNFVGAGPEDTISYQLALGAMTFVSLLAISPLIWVQEQRSQAGDARATLPWQQLKKHGLLLTTLLLPQFVIGLGAGTMQPFMNIHFRIVYDKADSVVGILFAMGALGLTIAQFVAPPMADRWGKVRTVIFSQMMSIPFLMLLALGAYLVPAGIIRPEVYFWVAALAFFIRLSLMNLGGPVYQTFILEQVPPELQAIATSLNMISFQFGWAAMPSISGWFQVTFAPFGFVPVFLTVVLLYGTSIIMQSIFFREQIKADRASLRREASVSYAPGR
ncbi:MAG: MFS transporter [Chloroflexi bacterium]|nr:MFS transporter [Chloroflexota bacterium]